MDYKVTLAQRVWRQQKRQLELSKQPSKYLMPLATLMIDRLAAAPVGGSLAG